MSTVTDVIVLAGCGESETIDGGEVPILDQLNAFFSDVRGLSGEPVPGLKELNTIHGVGGTKAMQADVFMGAFRQEHLDSRKFLAHLLTLPWDCTEDVQVLMKHEYDDRWTMVMQGRVINEAHLAEREEGTVYA